jgi:hypothetical protein
MKYKKLSTTTGQWQSGSRPARPRRLRAGLLSLHTPPPWLWRILVMSQIHMHVLLVIRMIHMHVLPHCARGSSVWIGPWIILSTLWWIRLPWIELPVPSICARGLCPERSSLPSISGLLCPTATSLVVVLPGGWHRWCGSGEILYTGGGEAKVCRSESGFGTPYRVTILQLTYNVSFVFMKITKI